MAEIDFFAVMNKLDAEIGKGHRTAYPPALQKACDDPFDYALGLKNGKVFRFTSAREISSEWVALELSEDDSGIDFSCPRGVEVRVSEIVWVADAPKGS